LIGKKHILKVESGYPKSRQKKNRKKTLPELQEEIARGASWWDPTGQSQKKKILEAAEKKKTTTEGVNKERRRKGKERSAEDLGAGGEGKPPLKRGWLPFSRSERLEGGCLFRTGCGGDRVGGSTLDEFGDTVRKPLKQVWGGSRRKGEEDQGVSNGWSKREDGWGGTGCPTW